MQTRLLLPKMDQRECETRRLELWQHSSLLGSEMKSQGNGLTLAHSQARLQTSEVLTQVTVWNSSKDTVKNEGKTASRSRGENN